MTITNQDAKRLSFLKKVNASGEVVLVACPSDFKVGTATNISNLTVTGDTDIGGDMVVQGLRRCFKAPIVLGALGAPNIVDGAPQLAVGSVCGIANTTSGSFTIPQTMQTILIGPVTIGDGSVMTIDAGAKVVIKNFDDF